MISAEAAAIRAGLEPETIDPSLTLEVERRLWDDAARSETLHPGTREHLTTIGGVRCSVVEPADASTDWTMVYVHGGGFISGSPITHRCWASRLAHATGLNVVIVDYPLLPEHSFPAPVEAVVSVINSIASSTAPGSQAPVIVVGDSTGAALAVASACVMRDAGNSPVRGIISLSGAFDATLTAPSLDDGLDPQLTRPVLEHWQDIITPGADPADPMVSPLFADLSDIPPLLLLAGDHDAWFSDSVRMASRAEHAGCDVTLQVFDDMWHVWPMHGDFPEATAALRSVQQFVRTHLRSDPG